MPEPTQPFTDEDLAQSAVAAPCMVRVKPGKARARQLMPSLVDGRWLPTCCTQRSYRRRMHAKRHGFSPTLPARNSIRLDPIDI